MDDLISKSALIVLVVGQQRELANIIINITVGSVGN